MKKLIFLCLSLLGTMPSHAIDDLVQVDGVWYDCHPNGTATAYSVYDVPADVTDITIQSSVICKGTQYPVVNLRDDLFYQNENVVNVVLGDNITAVPSNAFVGCTKLKTVILGNSVTSIGSNAFLNVKTLESVTLGPHVTLIDTDAFSNCSALATVEGSNVIEEIGREAFLMCRSLKSFRLTKSVTKVGYGAFQSCSGLEHFYAERTTPADYNFYNVLGTYATFTFVSSECVLHIPQWCGEAYSVTPWTPFKHIVEDLPSDYVPDYTPKNLAATEEDGNIACLTWDKVYYADAYRVYIDNEQAVETSELSYTSLALSVGEHSAYVEAWANSELKGMSDVLSFRIVGNTPLPAENLEVVKVEKDGSSSYNVTIRFNLPETRATVQSYKLYYGSGIIDYVSFTEVTKEGNTITATISLSKWDVTEEDEITGEDVPRTDVPLSVVIIYNEGTADPSDVVLCNFAQGTENLLPVTDFAIIKTEKASSYYNVTIRFTAPETDATINGYKLYYGNDSYDCESFTIEPTADLPEGLGAVDYTMTVTGRASGTDYDGATAPAKVVISGSDIYVSGLAIYFKDNFIKGTISGSQAIFANSQFVGEDEYGKEYLVGMTKSDNTYQVADNIVFDYNEATQTLTLADDYILRESSKVNGSSYYTQFTAVTLTPKEGAGPQPVAKNRTFTTTVSLWASNVSETDSEGNKVGSSAVPLWVTVVYEPQDSKRSNLVYWDFANNQECTGVSLTLTNNFTAFSSEVPLDFSSTTIKVYTAKQQDDKVVLTEVADGQVPARTGVILKGEAGEYTIPTVQPMPLLKNNDLIAAYTDMTVKYESYSSYNYILQKNAFYKATGAKLRKGKAYLSLYNYNIEDTNAPALPIVIYGETTDITEINTATIDNSPSTAYDLQGRPVANPKKGLYIFNGKKVVIQ